MDYSEKNIDYVELIRDYTEDKAGTQTGRALNAPVFVLFLGVKDGLVELIKKTLTARWINTRKYINFCVINTDADSNHYGHEDIGDYAVLHTIDIQRVSNSFENPWVKAAMADYLWRMYRHSNDTLAGYVEPISVTCICGVDNSTSLWAGRCSMILKYIASKYGDTINESTLITLLPLDQITQQNTIRRYWSNCSQWQKAIPDEGLFPEYDGGRVKRPVQLMPCNKMYGAGETSIFTRYLYVDERDSTKQQMTDNEKASLIGFIIESAMLDPELWDRGNEADPHRNFCAYLYPPYADRHETDIALTLRLCNEQCFRRQTNDSEIISELRQACNDLMNELKECAKGMNSMVNGFIIHKGDKILNEEKGTMSLDEAEKRFFGESVKSEYDFYWAKVLTRFKIDVLPEWRTRVERILRKVKSTDSLDEIRRHGIAESVADSAGGQKSPGGVVEFKKMPYADIPGWINQLESRLLDNYKPRIAERERAVFMANGFSADHVISAVLDRSISEELERMIASREKQLRVVGDRISAIDEKLDAVIGAFEKNMTRNLGANNNGYSRDSRARAIADLPRFDSVIAKYGDAIEAPANRYEYDLKLVIGAVLSLFEEQGFTPVAIENDNDRQGVRAACRLFGTCPEGAISGVVADGVDANRRYSIIPVIPEQNILAIVNLF